MSYYGSPTVRGRLVRATLGTVNGGIGVNWEYLGLEKEEFKDFLHQFLGAMGFRMPTTVHIERNSLDERVDWNRMRISAEECELHGVYPEAAVLAGRQWLRCYRHSRYPYLRFDLGRPAPV